MPRLFWVTVITILASGRATLGQGGQETIPFQVKAACDSVGISPNRQSIIAKLQSLTPNTQILALWEKAIQDLGDPNFQKREEASQFLLAQGPALKGRINQALKSPDLEISRRAQEIVNSVPFLRLEAWLETTLAWLASNPETTDQDWLVSYLPWIEQNNDSPTSMRLIQNLLEMSGRLNRWEWAGHIVPGDAPLLRWAAAQVPFEKLQTTGTAGSSNPALAFANDPDPRVRFACARQGFARGNLDSARELANLLKSLPEGETRLAEELLQSLGGPELNGRCPLVQSGKLNREACSKAWISALAKAETQALVTSRGVNGSHNKAFGITLVVEFDGPTGGRVYLLGADWKPLWEINGLSGPNDVQMLPDGNLLIAERSACRVTERTPTGTICWEHGLSNGPIAAQRTPFGTTVIATFQEVVEVDRVGREIRRHQHSKGFREVKVPETGYMHCVTGDGTIQFLDQNWQVIHACKPERHGQGAAYWASLARLGNGRLLVSLGGEGKLVEIDKEGKIHWSATVPAAVFAQRLGNGNTLVCSFDGRALVEIDSGGKEVGRLPLEGRPFLALRR